MKLLLLAAAAFAWTPVERRVAVLYHPKHLPPGAVGTFHHPVHQRAEVVLNHLGLDVEYYDVTAGLPPAAGLRGVLLWTPSASWPDDPRPLCRWLSGALEKGVRVALVGQVGLHSGGAPDFKLSPDCARALRALGVESKGLRVVDGLSVSSAAYARALGFERKPDPTETGVLPLVAVLPGGTPLARLHLADGEVRRTDVVAVTARGGVALDPLWLYANQELEPHRVSWITDPFVFFEAAFGLAGLPRPDVTTLNGRRIFMTRVDGDGFFNISEVDRKKFSGEVFVSEFIEKHSATPFTVSLIAGYYDLALYDDERSISLSRRALNAPNVEPASHGYAHPLVWSTGEPALRVPRYSYDAAREIVGSGELLARRLLPAGKQPRVFFWTGDCLPGEAELRIAEEAGLFAMNGGGGRLDRFYPSYAHLFPLGRRVGSARQIYAAISNENDFTGLWSGPFYGYRDAIETFERTGAPRRVKPVDVYVHFYSAERWASVEALRKVYAWAHAQPLIPVHAGRWAQAARDFFAMRISRDGSRFRLDGGAAVRTVRFESESRAPDLRASRGVIGWRRELGSLYVFLDASDRREIALTDQDPGGIRLEEANFEVDGWRPEGAGVRFSKRGWWDPECVIAGLAPGRDYRVKTAGFAAAVKADAAGRLRLRLPRQKRPGTAAEVIVE